MIGEGFRVCIITSEYHTEEYRAGGVGFHSAKVAKWLCQNGHEVHVCVIGNKRETFQEMPNLVVHRYPRYNLWHWRLAKIRKKPAWLYQVESIVATRKLVLELHAQHPFDLIHAFMGYLCMGLFRRGDLPIIVRATGFTPEFHALNHEPRTSELKLHLFLRKLELKRADAIYTSAYRTAHRWEAVTGRKMPVIRTPMFPLEDQRSSVDVRNITGGRSYILYCTALIGCKGADIAARAMARVLDRHADVDFVVIGRDGRSSVPNMSMSDYMRGELGRHKGRCHFLGIVPHVDLMVWMQQARFIISPSRADNLPNVLLEAMYLAKVLVGTHDASYDEIIEDAVDGFLAENGNAESLENKIEVALGLPPDELARMGGRAFEKARRIFHPDRVMNQLIGFYKCVLGMRI